MLSCFPPALILFEINTDPYTTPVPDRIVRAIPGNGPIEDVTSIDLQCGGVNGGGTKPAKLQAEAAAGSNVALNWTIWPTSHSKQQDMPTMLRHNH